MAVFVVVPVIVAELKAIPDAVLIPVEVPVAVELVACF
jgi:hypothetical protein